jgi:hypothetical protein
MGKRWLQSERGSVLAESALVTSFAILTALASLNLHFFIEAYSQARSITYELGRNASSTPGMHMVNWEEPQNRQRTQVESQARSLFDGYGVPGYSGDVILAYNPQSRLISVQTRILVSSFRPAFLIAPEAKTSANYVYLIPTT